MKRGLNINLNQLQFDVSNCNQALKDFCVKSIKDVIADSKKVISMNFGFKAAKGTLFVSTGNDDDYLGDYFDDIVRSIIFVDYCQSHYQDVLNKCSFANYLKQSGSKLTVNDVLTITDQYIKRQLRNASLVFGDILEMLWSNDVQRQCINRLEEAYFDDLKDSNLIELTVQLRKLTFNASVRLNEFFEQHNVLPTYATTYYVYELNSFIDQLPKHFKDIYYPQMSPEMRSGSVPKFELPSAHENEKQQHTEQHKKAVYAANEQEKTKPSYPFKDEEWSHVVNSAIKGLSLVFGTMSFLINLKKMMRH